MIRLGSDKNSEKGQKRMCQAVCRGSWEVVEKSTIFIIWKIFLKNNFFLKRTEEDVPGCVQRKLGGGGEINYLH